jgi:hypothetical protein
MFDLSKLYLITTNDWFHAKDGQNYKAVWGKAQVVEAKNELGFIPKAGTNWYVRVGEGEGSMIIAGCQVHYVQEFEKRPTGNSVLCIGKGVA